MTCFGEDGFGIVGALPAAVAAAGQHAQFLKRMHAAATQIADLPVSDSIADANKHGNNVDQMRTIVNSFRD